MSIRDRLLALAIEAEADNKTDAANAMYLLGALMDEDGSQCRLNQFIDEMFDEYIVYPGGSPFEVTPDVLSAVACGVSRSLKIPVEV